MAKRQFKKIVINARRAKYMAEHWDDSRLVVLPWGGKMTMAKAVRKEVDCIQQTIDKLMDADQVNLMMKLLDFKKEVETKEFWKKLVEDIKGTRFSAGGLDFKFFEYESVLKPIWEMESCLERFLRKRAREGWLIWIWKKVLLVGLVWYAIHLWSPPAGDAPKPEPAEPKPVVAEKKAEAQPKAATAEQPAGTLAVGTRVVAKKAIPIYRLNEERKPVVAGRVPAGTVLEVTGTVNAKVVRVSVELPNGKKGKGMARVADLEE